jgi:triacylglycerol lipase
VGLVSLDPPYKDMAERNPRMIDLNPRTLPPETVDGLRPPLVGFPYFAHADRFPFQANAPSDSAVNAWWLADASFLVYGESSFIAEALRGTPLADRGFTLDWLGTAEDNRGMVLSSETALVVVFRGTRLQVHSVLDLAEVVVINQSDLWVDSQFLPRVWRAGGRVHGGFLRAFEEVSDRLDAIVRGKTPRQKLWLTGHSLGGALATMAAAHVDPTILQGVITFGSPRVGDPAFVGCLAQERMARYVHRDDWVATVPPEFLGFTHGGTWHPVPGSPRRNLRGDFQVGLGEFGAALASMAKDLRVRFGDLPFKVSGLADHAPVYYATLLWNALLASTDPAE